MTHTTLFACFTLVVGALAQNATPNVTLPWGIWQGERYANDQKITLFKNVRFGDEPPRFGAPAFPSWQFPGIRDPSYGPNCIQVNTSTLKNPPGGQPNFQLPRDGDAVQSEDCLFLDIYAPAHNFDSNGRPIKQLPVIVWFYGGAYAFGSKSLGGGVPLYTGQSMVAGQDYEAIFVAGNYRLGAFGWLAGSYMQDAGQPNAGLYDQALLLKWVQQYITQVGGDPNDVSAWGESAGAGSIMHHLIREGGTVDPLFKKFLVQSPAFEWSWDNSDQGTLDQVFKNFSQLAGCGSYDMNCLRARSVDVLTTANQELFNNVRPTGLFPVGPSVDGKWIQTIPALSYAANKVWPKIEAAIISHVSNETASFTPSYVVSQASFDHFLNLFFPEPSLAGVRTAINSTYNCQANYGGDYRACVATLIRDSTFTCNTRQLFEAFPKISYMLRYSFWSDSVAVHASDLIATFMNSYKDAINMLAMNNMTGVKADVYAAALDFGASGWYQDYLSSFGRYGDPNTGKKWDAYLWNVATPGEKIGNVLEIYDTDSERFISDDQNTRSTCGFWTKIANAIERAGANTESVPELGDLTQDNLEL